MLRVMPVSAVLVFLGFAQTARMEFEVASVKPSAAPAAGRAALIGCKGGPGTEDPTVLICGNMNADLLIVSAYGIKYYQLIGPEWLRTTRFDITANVPVGATKEQVPEMWKNLLAERFHLEVHRETRDATQFDSWLARMAQSLSRLFPPTVRRRWQLSADAGLT